MKGEDRYRLLGDIAGLTVFTGLKTHPLIKALVKLLKVLDADRVSAKDFALELADVWAAFTGTVLFYNPDASFYTALAALTLADENPFTRAARGRKEQDFPALLAVTRTDLSRLGRIARLDLVPLGFYIAALLRDGGLEELARGCEETARALWRGVAAGNSAPAEIFPEGSDWAEALPVLAEYIAAHGR
jgi:hypothetical protein